MSELDGDSQDKRRFWKIEVVVWAEESQVSGLTDDLQHLLCPDAGHRPPCPIPWEIGWHEIDESDSAVEDLRMQVQIEYPE